MRFLLPILCVLVPLLASKERLPLQNLQENEKSLLFELVKRLGKGSDYELGWREKAQSSRCQVSTENSSIIKRIDSENNGAKFLTLHDDVETNEKCSDLCCRNSSCDLAVYENKGEHHCYLFQCEGKCLFGHHSSYISNTIDHRIQLPPSAADGSELDLINLDQDSDTVGNDKEDSFPPTTPATSTLAPPTPAPYIRAHSVGLEGPYCQRDLHCEDPNAVCNYHKCRCREGYYQKGHICRQNCPPSNFGCLELGTLGRGPQCVSASQVCDSVMQCADGSDEFNCSDSDGPYKSPEAPAKDSNLPPQDDKTGRHGDRPVGKPDSPSRADAEVPKHAGDASTSDNKGKLDTQPPSSSKNTENKNKDDHKKPADGTKETPQKTPVKDSSAKDTLTDNADGFPEPKGDNSDLAKGSSMQEPTPFEKGSDTEDLIQRQNEFISKVKLDTPKEPANMQGPIIALSLGLAFTVILLIFVACRLRMVRRRLRKGRPLHSNEADYLINGMYL